MELALRPLCVSMMVLTPAFLLGAKVFSKKLLKLYRISRGDEPRAQMSSREIEATLSKWNKRSSDVVYVGVCIPQYACNNDWWQRSDDRLKDCPRGV